MHAESHSIDYFYVKKTHFKEPRTYTQAPVNLKDWLVLGGIHYRYLARTFFLYRLLTQNVFPLFYNTYGVSYTKF